MAFPDPVQTSASQRSAYQLQGSTALSVFSEGLRVAGRSSERRDLPSKEAPCSMANVRLGRPRHPNLAVVAIIVDSTEPQGGLNGEPKQ